MRAAALCLLIATPAVADPDAMRESALVDPGFMVIQTKMLALRYRLDAVAAGLASTDGNERQGGGVGTASVDLGLGAKTNCDLVAAGAQVSGRSSERLLSISQWASICPLAEMGSGRGYIDLDHRLDWDVTPRLLAVPSMRQGAQRRETVGFDFVGSLVPWHADEDPNDPTTVEWIQGGRARMEVAVGWSDDERMKDVLFFFDIVFRTYHRDYHDDKPLTLDVAKLRMDVAGLTRDPDERTSGTLAADLGKIEGLRAGPFRFGARLGGRVGGIAKGRDETYAMEHIAVGEGALSAELGPARLEGERKSFVAWDTRLVVDNRATASVRGSLDLSIAHTALRGINTRAKAVTGGVLAEAAYDVSKHLSLRARSEFGRSLYIPGVQLEQPRWASETMLLVAARAQKGATR